MTRYIAFLRAINVGGHTVKMDRLRELFVELGLQNVESFIASGNIIFDSEVDRRALEDKIESHLEAALGYEVRTFLRTVDEIRAIAQYQPFDMSILDADRPVLFVGFLKQEASREQQQAFADLQSGQNLFHTHKSEVYWQRLVAQKDNKLSNNKIEKAAGVSATFRNINTLNRLVKKYGG